MKTKITFEYSEDETNTTAQKLYAEEAWAAIVQIHKLLDNLETLEDPVEMHYLIKDIKSVVKDLPLLHVDLIE